MLKNGSVLKKYNDSLDWLFVIFVLYIKSVYVLSSLYTMQIGVIIISLLSLLPLLFFVSFVFLFKNKNRSYYLLGLNIFISVLFFADVVYARAFGHLISFYMIFAKGVTSGLGNSIISLISIFDLILFIDLPVMLIKALKKENTNIKRRVSFFFFTAILTTVIMGMQFQNLENNKLLGNFKTLPLYMSPLGNHFYDIYRFYYEKSDDITSDELIKISKWHNNNEKYQIPDSQFSDLQGLFKGKNLIVIQVESLENIMIGFDYSGNEITPNINKLLENSIYFDNIIEQVRDGNSSDAELLFNTSMYPISNGSAFLRFGVNEYNSLPNLLKEEGYTSIALHGDDKEFWNRDMVLPNLGYDRYIDESQFGQIEEAGMGVLDEFLFDQSLQEIKSLKQPFNIFIITLTSHIPFDLPEEYRKLNFHESNVTADYLQSIHYVDLVFGDFYKSLDQNGILDNSVIVIYGDHEGIHKYYSTELPENNKEVPFIIYSKGFEGFKVDTFGGQVDMMPTLAYLMGIDTSKYDSTVMGRNLLSKYSGSPIYSTGEVITKADDIMQLKEGLIISDISIRSNYLVS